MRKNVKLLALCVSFLLVLSAFAGCNNTGSTVDPSVPGNTTQTPGSSTDNPNDVEPVTVSWVRGGDPNLAPDNDAVGQFILDKFFEDTGEKIILEPTFISWSTFNEQLYSLITAGINPGITTSGPSHEYWAKGYIIDIKELADKYAPAMNEVYSEEEIRFFQGKDGSQYGLPLGGRNVNYAITLREDKMTAYNIEKSVTTLEELEAAFDIYMANEPEGLAVATPKYRWYTMVAAFAGLEAVPWVNSMIDIDGEILPAYLSENMIDFLTIAKRWYNNKYVSSDVFTIDQADAEKIFESGNAFSVIDYADMAVRWRFGKRLNMVEPDAIPFTVGPVKTPYNSGFLMGESPSTSGSLQVFTNCDPKVAEMAVKYYNWEISDPINWLTTHFGIEGENFYLEDGKMGYPEKWSVEGSPENYSGYWQIAGEPPMYAEPPFMPENVDDLPQFLPSQQMLANAEVILNPVTLNCPYFPMDEHSTDFSSAVEELEILAAEIIVGKQSIEAWANAQSIWENAGGNALSEVLTNIYSENKRG